MSQLVAPEIPQTQNPVAPFLSAFLATSQIANRRRQLEDQLMKMDMQNKLAEQRLYLQGLNYQSLDVARQAEAAKALAGAEQLKSKAEKSAAQSQDLIQFQDSLNQIDAQPGTTQFRVQANLVRSKFPQLMATPEGQRIWTQTWNQHAFTAKEQMNSHAAVVKDFDQQMKSEKINPYWLENPDQWVGIDKSGKETTDPNKVVSRALKFTGDEKGIYPAPPDTKPADVKLWKTLPKDRFDSLVKQYDAYKGVIQGIVTGAQEPDTTAKPVQDPNSQPKVLDANTAKQFLDQAGGDKQKARDLAKQAGYSF